MIVLGAVEMAWPERDGFRRQGGDAGSVDGGRKAKGDVPRMDKGKVRPITKPPANPPETVPANIDAERFVLGSILLDGSRFGDVADTVRHDDFLLEKHRRIFTRMMEVNERGETIDRVTVANELLRYKELESVDGLSYLISLDDGLPHIANLDSYFRIIREKAVLRRIANAAQHLQNRALIGEEDSGAILDSLEAQIQTLRVGIDLRTSGGIEDLPAVTANLEELRYLREPELPEGLIVALTGNSGSGKSTLATAWARDLIATGRPVLILDRENPRVVAIDRMQRLGLKDCPFLRWAGGWTGDVPGPDAPAILKWVRDCELKPLIIIDSLIAFLNGDENDAGEMRHFMKGLRRLADLGATIIVIHHDGKSDSSRDFRGSSDFKAAIDQAFHVTNVGSDMRLDRIRLRPFKARLTFAGDIVYKYAEGRLVRDESRTAPAKTVTAQLRNLLRMNPGITVSEFEKRAAGEGVARARAREFVTQGVLDCSIKRESGPNNKHRLVWNGGTIE